MGTNTELLQTSNPERLTKSGVRMLKVLAKANPELEELKPDLGRTRASEATW